MKNIVKLTESDLNRIIRKVIKENEDYNYRSMYDPYYDDDDEIYDDKFDKESQEIKRIERDNRGPQTHKENKDSENLYSDINNLIADNYSDMDPAEIAEALKNIHKNFEAQAYRKKKGIGHISYDDVKKNWSR